MQFADKHNLLPKAQIGFRKNCRTADHILSLKTLIEKYATGPNKYLFGCFVDFKTAFDTISRTALIFKLLKAGIGGNFLGVIQNMYSDVSYSVKLKESCSPSFQSNIGVKQGCVLSPLLFNIFVRDLPDIFDASCDPVALLHTELSCLMFADDLVLLSKSHSGLQNSLDKLKSYCDKWGLTVNLSKTKVIIFNKGGKLLKKFNFTYKGNVIDIVQNYCYLGIVFNAAGSFKPACSRLCDQALKALFKIKQLNIRNNIGTALKLFNSLIVPILMYGSEIWSPYFTKGLNEINFLTLCENLPAEKVLLKFAKYILGVQRNATSSAVRGELGLFGLLTTFLVHAVKYWLRLKDSTSDKSSIVYEAFLTSKSLKAENNWAKFMEKLLSTFGQEGCWDNPSSWHPTQITKHVRDSINSRFLSNWSSSIDLNSNDMKNTDTNSSNCDRNCCDKKTCSNHGNESEKGLVVKSKLRSYKCFKYT
jgi:hypothetical protein